MSYDSTKPSNDGFLANAPQELRINQEGLRTGQIVDAGTIKGLTPGNAAGQIPISNGTQCTGLNAEKVGGNLPSAFAPAAHNHAVATSSSNGFMGNTDKAKLDSVATGAEVNQNAFANVLVGGTTVQADSKTDTLEMIAGQNIAITPDAANDKITIAISGKVPSAANADNATNAGNATTVGGNLPSAFAPNIHKSQHATGGSDALSPSDIGAAPINSPNFSGFVNAVSGYKINGTDITTKFAPSGYGLGMDATIITDFNSITSSGFYRGTNATNSPPAYSKEWITVLAISIAPSSAMTMIAQSYHPNDECKIWTRTRYGGSWSGWTEVIVQNRTVKLGNHAPIVAGSSGSDYPILGYGVTCTDSANAYLGNGDCGAFIKFGVYNTPIDFWRTPAVTSGAPSSPVRLGYFDAYGNLYINSGNKQVATIDQLDPGHSFGANGWQQLSNGLIIQWGTAINYNGNIAVTYPVSFPNGSFSPPILGCYLSGYIGAAYCPIVNNYSRTGFTAAMYTEYSTVNVQWFAIGN